MSAENASETPLNANGAPMPADDVTLLEEGNPVYVYTCAKFRLDLVFADGVRAAETMPMAGICNTSPSLGLPRR